MYESKVTPGKRFGSGFAGKNYDDKHSENGMHTLGGPEASHEAPHAAANMEPVKQKEDEKIEGKKELHPVVAEHGKAHKVVITHHEDGKHSVQSHHAKGHMNSSEHETSEEAHSEGRKLAGVPADGQEKEHESPFGQGKDQQGASSEEDGFAMPDLA